MLTTLCLLLAVPCPPQQILAATPGRSAGPVGAAGDVDGDGTVDLFAVSRPLNGTTDELVISSGRTSYTLRTIPLNGIPIDLVESAAGVGDVDGDGHPDVLLGFPREGAAFTGAARVYSTADGSLLHEILGQSSGELLGWSVAGGEDFDGDGRSDFIVSSTFGSSSGAGSVQVVSGSTGGVIHTLTTPSSPGAFGAAVAIVDDLDGDGVRDFAVGVPDGTVSQLRLYSSSAGTLIRSITPPSPWRSVGSSLALTGDMDGDGVGELAAGGYHTIGSGALVVSAVTGNLLHEVPQASFEVAGLLDGDGDGIGDFATGGLIRSGIDASLIGTLGSSALVGVGDVDGDGLDDLALRAGFASLHAGEVFGLGFDLHELYGVGAVSVVGDLDQDGHEDFAAYDRLVSGRDGSTLHTYPGPSAAATDDLDGDGLPEAVIWGGAGAYTLNLTSSSSGQVLHTIQKSFNFASRILTEGDFDGDGVGDLLTAAPNASTLNFYSGGVWAFSTTTGAQLFVSRGRQKDGNYGADLALMGDLDGDGREDFAVGAPGETQNGATGRVHLRSGLDGSRIRVVKGPQGALGFGRSVARVTDLDGDGIRDLAIGAPAEVLPSGGRGVVYIVSTATGAFLRTIRGEFADGQGNPVNDFGAALGLAGDQDLDGHPDLGVGAPLSSGAGMLFVFASDDGALLSAREGRVSGEKFGAWFLSLDLTADGRDDLLVASPSSPAPASVVSQGRLEMFDGASSSVAAYCGPQPSANQCEAEVVTQGTASRSLSTGFQVSALKLEGGQPGIVFFGSEAQQRPWQGGFTNLCVAPPLIRTGVFTASGSAATCDGTFAFDFNAWMTANPHRAPAAGAAAYAQAWFMDPGAPGGSSLSSAVVFSVQP